jgi:hypothetical protein
VGINSRKNEENERNSELLKLAKLEIQRIGIANFAKRIGCDPSNLQKSLRAGLKKKVK